ncbi:recombinase family protein [Fictibacillus barbaricus]|uniref:Site-specific DNA recombinase n=1 Tax=Fictibacillus barbaricus TaxID=182136 RepID=A0ABU1U5F2_9BACL|nr:recombinase family protein [Fictibacillus barbaricus]MDR7074682.1 site-specific DNA recombinase [Fictibacillus barbaricus]
MFRQSEEIDQRDIGIYTRVSTEEQAREGLSLDEQKNRLESYCHAMGWNQHIRFFIDEGESAKNLERPQLKLLMEEVKENNLSRIIVTKLDRLSRKLSDLLALIDLFQSHKVSFISISESFDTNTPSGRLTLQVLGAVAEFERERIRERVIDNMFHAANQGQWLTSAPFGYKLADKRLVIDENEANIVRRIYGMFLKENMGYFAIAKKLNEEGIPSHTGKEWWNRTIKLMITNPAYKGTTIWNRLAGSTEKREKKDVEEWVIIEGTHEPIIDPEIWEEVQKKAEKKRLPARSQRSTHLLSGILKCGLCGSGMSHDRAGSKNSKYGVYRCSANKNKGTCTGKVYRSAELELLFKESLLQLSKDFTLHFLPSIEPAKDALTSTALQQKVHNAKKRYQRKVEAYTAGLIEMEDLQNEKERMDTLVSELEASEVIEVNPKAIEENIKSKLRTLMNVMDQLPVSVTKALIKEVVEKVVVKGEHDIEIHLK